MQLELIYPNNARATIEIEPVVLPSVGEPFHIEGDDAGIYQVARRTCRLQLRRGQAWLKWELELAACDVAAGQGG